MRYLSFGGDCSSPSNRVDHDCIQPVVELIHEHARGHHRKKVARHRRDDPHAARPILEPGQKCSLNGEIETIDVVDDERAAVEGRQIDVRPRDSTS